jgi:hypothetical protein
MNDGRVGVELGGQQHHRWGAGLPRIYGQDAAETRGSSSALSFLSSASFSLAESLSFFSSEVSLTLEVSLSD